MNISILPFLICGLSLSGVSYSEASTIPTYCLFSHGFGGSGSNIKLYKLFAPDTIPFPIIRFDYADAQILINPFQLKHSSFAQKDDVETLATQIRKLKAVLKKIHGENYRIILFGVSRGAATIIMFLATYPDELDHIAAVIIESPFDSMEHCIQDKPKTLRSLGEKLICYSEYQADYETPLKAATKIKTDIPILFIATKNDLVVPFEGTQAVYQEVAKHNKNVEFFVFEKGIHGLLAFFFTGSKYKDVVHSFLRSHGLIEKHNSQ